MRLTAAGRKIARKLTLRHHLIERMLSEMFGMEWYKVHDEAERLEHAVSPDFEAKLLAKLGRGGACPHGNLSEMESPASRRRRGLVLLSEAEAGQALPGQRDLRARPPSAGISGSPRHIRPGAKLGLVERNYDKTLSIRTPSGTMVLRPFRGRQNLGFPSRLLAQYN